MRKPLVVGALALIGLVAAAGLAWWGTAAGWWGTERDAGVIDGPRLPDRVIAARAADVAGVRPAGHAKQILFGDLHVHTTYSTDAFQWALPLNGGPGAFPLADACDFARYCASLDFWAITDHAEASTPVRWQRTKESIRQCQRIAGSGPEPDLVSFVGFEWTQVGRTPDEHYGHHNVIFRDLDDASIAARPIASAGLTTQALRTTATGLRPGIVALDPEHATVYLDFNTFLRKVREVPECRPGERSDRLPATCYEQASTPGELIRRLDEQGLEPLVVPHGSTWGFYTPPGSSWDKALKPAQAPDRLRLVEIYSGHGNSEEYRNWNDMLPGPPGRDGPTGVCPRPTATYTPSCWRAGEIIAARCRAEGGRDCAKRAAFARWAYVNMGVAGHLAVKGEAPEDWLDAGQCTDCFLPAFNYRPKKSVQYGLAVSRFEPGGTQPRRFRWGFVASSDNHRARPGTGYKQVDRRRNTEASGPINERFRRLLVGEDEAKDAKATLIPRERLGEMAGFQLTEFERQTSFFLTGGLVAAHAPRRERRAIWDALQRREVYATSGPRILLWFDLIDTETGRRLPMGSEVERTTPPTFEVKAVGAFEQKPGCPSFDAQGMDAARLRTLCSGECFNPSDERRRITRIEVVRIRPQARPGEPVDGLIEDKFLVHRCAPNADGCSFRFTDPGYAAGRRDALYYVRAIQDAEPVINAEPVRCVRDAAGKCIEAKLCYGDYRSGSSECRAPAEPRAWSSPIYVDWPRATRG